MRCSGSSSAQSGLFLEWRSLAIRTRQGARYAHRVQRLLRLLRMDSRHGKSGGSNRRERNALLQKRSSVYILCTFFHRSLPQRNTSRRGVSRSLRPHYPTVPPLSLSHSGRLPHIAGSTPASGEPIILNQFRNDPAPRITLLDEVKDLLRKSGLVHLHRAE